MEVKTEAGVRMRRAWLILVFLLFSAVSVKAKPFYRFIPGFTTLDQVIEDLGAPTKITAVEMSNQMAGWAYKDMPEGTTGYPADLYINFYQGVVRKIILLPQNLLEQDWSPPTGGMFTTTSDGFALNVYDVGVKTRVNLKTHRIIRIDYYDPPKELGR